MHGPGGPSAIYLLYLSIRSNYPLQAACKRRLGWLVRSLCSVFPLKGFRADETNPDPTVMPSFSPIPPLSTVIPGNRTLPLIIAVAQTASCMGKCPNGKSLPSSLSPLAIIAWYVQHNPTILGICKRRSTTSEVPPYRFWLSIVTHLLQRSCC